MKTIELSVIIIILLITFIIVFGNYFSCFYQAKVYNEINGTHFTWFDFLMAKDQINNHTQTIKLK